MRWTEDHLECLKAACLAISKPVEVHGVVRRRYPKKGVDVAVARAYRRKCKERGIQPLFKATDSGPRAQAYKRRYLYPMVVRKSTRDHPDHTPSQPELKLGDEVTPEVWPSTTLPGSVVESASGPVESIPTELRSVSVVAPDIREMALDLQNQIHVAIGHEPALSGDREHGRMRPLLQRASFLLGVLVAISDPPEPESSSQ